MKRLFTLVLIAVLLFLPCSSVITNAANEPLFYASNAEGSPGEEIQVIVKILGNPGLIALGLQIGYDDSKLQLISSIAQEFKDVSFGPVTGNPFNLSWDDVLKPNSTQNGNLALLTFKILDDAPIGETTITVSYDEDNVFDSNFDNVFFNTQNATITIKEAAVHVTGVTIETTLSIGLGETKTPSFKVLPEDATNQSVSFEIDDPTIAAVNESTGAVTGLKQGTTTLTITTADGSFQATCAVTVSCSHSSKTIVGAKSSTCSERGWDSYAVCDDCGQLFDLSGKKIDEIPYKALSAHSRAKSVRENVIDATCDTDGSYDEVIYCKNCGVEISRSHKKISATGHTFGDWIDDNDGVHHSRTCHCGEKETDTHTWNEGEITVQPSHVREGVRTYTCTVCGATKTETIAKTNEHAFDIWTDDKDGIHHSSTCECGEKQTAEHTWDEGVVTTQPTHQSEGVKTFTCSLCGATKTEAMAVLTDHVYGSWTDDKDGVHHSKTCVCGDTVTEAHTWDNGVVTIQPTHMAEGVKTFTCTGCGATKTVTLEKLTQHAFGDWTDDKDGQHHSRTCECGEKETGTHTWNNGVITTRPTHSSEGVKTFTCTLCGATKTEVVPKTTQHEFGPWSADADGLHHSRNCPCGEKEKDEHHWNNGEVTTQPTHTSEGVRTFTCSDCGATRTEVIEKNQDHEFGPWTDTTDGIHHKRTCACGEEETAEHLWGEPDASGMISCTACGAHKESESDDQETTPVEVIINEDAFGKPHFEGDMTEIADKFLTEEEQSRIEAGEKLNILLEVQDVKDTISEEEKELIENEVGEYQVALYLDISVMKQIGSDDPTVITQTNGKVKLSIEVPQELKLEGMDVKIVRLHEGVATVINAEYDSSNHTVSFETDQFSTYALAVSEKETSESILKKGCGSVLTTGTIGIAFVCLFALFALKKKEQID